MIFFLRYYYFRKLLNILHLHLEHLTSLPRNYNAVEVIFMIICMFFCIFNVLNVQCTVDCFVFGGPYFEGTTFEKNNFQKHTSAFIFRECFYMKYVSNNK